MRKTSMNENLIIDGLIIADKNGRFLVDLIRNKQLETAHLSGFIGALKMFGDETLGQINDISINGLDIDMLIVSAHELIMVAIMDSDLPDLNFRGGCERALEVFYKIFKDEIKNWNGDLNPFKGFRKLLREQMMRYLKELQNCQPNINTDIMDFQEIEEQIDKLRKIKKREV